MPTLTRFNEPWDPPSKSGSLLRAKASVIGLDLSPVTPVDLAASVVAADAWMLVNNASSLEHPAQFGAGAVRALLAVLSRAAGSPLAPPDPPVVCAKNVQWVSQADWYIAWLAGCVNCDVCLAASLVAADLSQAGSRSLLASFGDLIQVAADSFTDTAPLPDPLSG